MFRGKSALIIDSNRQQLSSLQQRLLYLEFVVTALSRIKRLEATIAGLYRVDIVFLRLDDTGIECENILQLLADSSIEAPVIRYVIQKDSLPYYQIIVSNGLPAMLFNEDCLALNLQQLLSDNLRV